MQTTNYPERAASRYQTVNTILRHHCSFKPCFCFSRNEICAVLIEMHVLGSAL